METPQLVCEELALDVDHGHEHYVCFVIYRGLCCGSSMGSGVAATDVADFVELICLFAFDPGVPLSYVLMA